MRKQFAAAVLSALLLTACSAGNTSQSSEETVSSENAAEENGGTADTSEPLDTSSPDGSAETDPISPALDPKDIEGIADLDNLYGPDGKKVDKYNLTSIGYGYDIEGNEDRTSWSYATTDHFAYYSEPSGFSYNSLDNADLFDAENRRFNVDIPSVTEYKRCAVGDKIGPLTVSHASSSFGINMAITNFMTDDKTSVLGRDLGIPEIFFQGSEIGFEGSVEMSGYIFICPEDEGYDERGDIFFFPDAQSCVLPVVYFMFDPENGVCGRNDFVVSYGEDFYYIGDYTRLYAGNKFRSELDLSDYPVDEPIKVRLIANDIYTRSIIDFVTLTSFTITDIEKI